MIQRHSNTRAVHWGGWHWPGLLLALAGLVLTLPGATAAQGERLVLAFYYAWFDNNTWNSGLSDQPVTAYSSADTFTIDRHVRQAQQAGIDALVQAWYGPGVENNQTEPNFWSLLEYSQRYGMRAAISVDMGSPSFLQSVDAVSAALMTLRDRHTQHGAYLRANGRPVVFFWKAEKFPVATWESIRNQIDPQHTMIWIAEGARLEYLAVFDGLYLYSVAWSGDPASVLTRWGGEVRAWGAAHGQSRYWVATTMPGYNDLGTGRADAFVRERQNGAYYRATWEGAVRSQADWVVITSFNEWPEGTYIEPSAAYGETYLNLTYALAQDYRTHSFSVATPEPTVIPESPTVTAEPLPTETSAPIPPTATATFTPTLTPTPTATPFRLATPTATPTPTFPPTLVLPPAPTLAFDSVPTITPVPPHRVVMGGTGDAPKPCVGSVLLPLTLVMVAGVLGRRRLC